MRWSFLLHFIQGAWALQSRAIEIQRPAIRDSPRQLLVFEQSCHFRIRDNRPFIPRGLSSTVLLAVVDSESPSAEVHSNPTNSSQTSESRMSLLRNLRKQLRLSTDEYRDESVTSSRSRRVLRTLKGTFQKPIQRIRSRLRRGEEEEVAESVESDTEKSNVSAGSTEDSDESPEPDQSIVETILAGMPRDSVDVVIDRTSEENTNATVQEREEATLTNRRRNITGDRWAVSSVDISGEWDIIATEEFKEEYDKYLTLLGQSMLVRSVAVSIVTLTTEETVQSEEGRKLLVRGRNVRGVWERELVSSGADEENEEYEPALIPIVSADEEDVYSEAWWENKGTVHVSWLRGVKKYGGGSFESRRYLDGQDVLVCESTFFPDDSARAKAKITWRFKRH